MYIVYVIRDKNGTLYKGMTGNLERRMKEHKSGKTKTTRKMDELKVVYTENFKDPIEARRREVYLKTAAGRRFLKNKIGPLA